MAYKKLELILRLISFIIIFRDFFISVAIDNDEIVELLEKQNKSKLKKTFKNVESSTSYLVN